jgi:Tfp pilus assembly protein PilN
MVEIIPKEIPQTPKWLNVLFYVSLILLIFSLAGYFVLGSSLKGGQETLKNLRTSIQEGQTAEKTALEKEILSYQKKINDFSIVVDSHWEVSRVFPALEKATHPKVSFSQFSLDVKNKSLTLGGMTQSFETLGQQLLILKEEDFVEKVSLNNISMDKSGKISFDLLISLNEKIFHE